MRLINVRKILQDSNEGIAGDAGLECAHAVILGDLAREGLLRRRGRPLVEVAEPRARGPSDICDLRLRHLRVRRRGVENHLQVQHIANVLQHLNVGGAAEVVEPRGLRCECSTGGRFYGGEAIQGL